MEVFMAQPFSAPIDLVDKIVNNFKTYIQKASADDFREQGVMSERLGFYNSTVKLLESFVKDSGIPAATVEQKIKAELAPAMADYVMRNIATLEARQQCNRDFMAEARDFMKQIADKPTLTPGEEKALAKYQNGLAEIAGTSAQDGRNISVAMTRMCFDPALNEALKKALAKNPRFNPKDSAPVSQAYEQIERQSSDFGKTGSNELQDFLRLKSNLRAKPKDMEEGENREDIQGAKTTPNFFEDAREAVSSVKSVVKPLPEDAKGAAVTFHSPQGNAGISRT